MPLSCVGSQHFRRGLNSRSLRRLRHTWSKLSPLIAKLWHHCGSAPYETTPISGLEPSFWTMHLVRSTLHIQVSEKRYFYQYVQLSFSKWSVLKGDVQYYRDSWSVILEAVTSAMESGDPSVRIALDGGDPLTTTDPPSNQDTSVHTATFFFVVFGLVFEALSTSTHDAGAQNSRTTIIALKALKCLVQAHYAGGAFQDAPIFEELVNLFYRMALTEPVNVQVHLVETLSSLATSIHRSQT